MQKITCITQKKTFNPELNINIYDNVYYSAIIHPSMHLQRYGFNNKN